MGARFGSRNDKAERRQRRRQAAVVARQQELREKARNHASTARRMAAALAGEVDESNTAMVEARGQLRRAARGVVFWALRNPDGPDFDSPDWEVLEREVGEAFRAHDAKRASRAIKAWEAFATTRSQGVNTRGA